MPQLPSVSELIGSTRVDSAPNTTIEAFPPSNPYGGDYHTRKDSTTSVSSTGISSDSFRGQPTDQSKHHQRLPSISNTILTSNSKRNSIDTSPRSSILLPGVTYSLVSRNENRNNNNSNNSLESLPSSRRLTESAIYRTANNPGVPVALATSNSGNSLSSQPFKLEQQQQQQKQTTVQQHIDSQRSGIGRPPVGSPIGSADKLQPLHMYISSPSTLHKQPPPPPPPAPKLPQPISHTRTNSTTISPTYNPHRSQVHEIAADNIDTSSIPQQINLPPAPPLHFNHSFPVSKSAPTSTTTSSYPLYFYQAVTTPSQNMPGQSIPAPPQPPPPQQELYYTQGPPQLNQTPPSSSSSVHNQNPIVAGPGYYIVQQPQQIPLPPAAPGQGSVSHQQSFIHPLPPPPVHHHVPPYPDQAHYDPQRPLDQGPVVSLQAGIYPYNVAYTDVNNALVNKRKIIKRRTRTGCLTCRKRRIKCDERKPTCYNCERLKKVCLGYENLSNSQPRKRVRDTSLDLPSNEGGVGLHQQQSGLRQ